MSTDEDRELMREWRRRHGLSQARAAEPLGVTVDQIKAIEKRRSRIGGSMRELMKALDLLARYEAMQRD